MYLYWKFWTVFTVQKPGLNSILCLCLCLYIVQILSSSLFSSPLFPSTSSSSILLSQSLYRRSSWWSPGSPPRTCPCSRAARCSPSWHRGRSQAGRRIAGISSPSQIQKMLLWQIQLTRVHKFKSSEIGNMLKETNTTNNVNANTIINLLKSSAMWNPS